MPTNTQRITTLESEVRLLKDRVAKLEAANQPAPQPTGIPPIPTGYGTKLKKNFADGTLAPFKVLTYPNDHPTDPMIKYGRFATGTQNISVHDGYLDLKAFRNQDGTWSQAFVGTFTADAGPTRTFDFQYGTVRAMIRMNTGKAAWPGFWLLDPWRAPEIDWPEMIGGKITANLHGSSANGQKYSTSVPTGWHEYGIIKTSSYIAFTLDGQEVARANVAMPARMVLLADSKVGIPWDNIGPDSTTPSPIYCHIAWVTVD